MEAMRVYNKRISDLHQFERFLVLPLRCYMTNLELPLGPQTVRQPRAQGSTRRGHSTYWLCITAVCLGVVNLRVTEISLPAMR